jgi:hypothetical protein
MQCRSRFSVVALRQKRAAMRATMQCNNAAPCIPHGRCGGNASAISRVYRANVAQPSQIATETNLSSQCCSAIFSGAAVLGESLP